MAFHCGQVFVSASRKWYWWFLSKHRLWIYTKAHLGYPKPYAYKSTAANCIHSCAFVVCNLFSYSQLLQPGANGAGVTLEGDCDLADGNTFVV